MILESEIINVGKVNKTHGVDGEMSASFYSDDAYDVIDVDTCLIFNIDGIYVPFFVDGVRTRGNESLLISLEGENTQEAASAFVGKDIYMRTTDLPEAEADDDDGLYAAQMIGYTAIAADGSVIGVIEDIDDSTENPLFIIDRGDDSKPVYIPITDDFITEISAADRRISFDLPEGLIDLNL